MSGPQIVLAFIGLIPAIIGAFAAYLALVIKADVGGLRTFISEARRADADAQRAELDEFRRFVDENFVRHPRRH